MRAARRSSPADSALLDDAVRDAIRLQEDIGLDVITDGEVRRVAWAQTPRFVDAFAATAGRGALNWRGATEGRFGCAGLRRPSRRVPGGGAAGRERAADRRHGRRVRVPRPLRAQQDQVHHAGAELPPPLLVTRALSRGRVRVGRRSTSPRSATTCGRWRDTLVDLGCDYIQLDAPNYGSLCDPDTRGGDACRRPRPGGGARIRRRARQLAVRRADRGHLGAARLPRQRPGGRVALGGRLRRDLRGAVPAAGGGPAAARVRLGPLRRLRAARRRAPGHGRRARPADHQVAASSSTTPTCSPASRRPPATSRSPSWRCPPSAASRRCPIANPVTPEAQRAKLELVVRLARQVWPR